MKLSYLALTSFLSASVAGEDASPSSLRTGASTGSSATPDHHHHHHHHHHHRHNASHEQNHDDDHRHGYNDHYQTHPYSNSISKNAFSHVQDSKINRYKRLQVRLEPNKLRNSISNSNNTINLEGVTEPKYEGAREATKAVAASAAVAAAVVVEGEEEEEECAPAMSKEEVQQLLLLDENEKTVILNNIMKMHLDSGILTPSPSCTSKDMICIQRTSSFSSKSTTGICIDKHNLLLDNTEDSTTIIGGSVGGGSGGYTDPSFSGVDIGMTLTDASPQASSPSSMLVVDEFDHHRSLQETCNDKCSDVGRPSVYDQYTGSDLYLSELTFNCITVDGNDLCPSEFKSIPVNCWNTTYIENFSYALAYQFMFNEAVDCWDTSSGTNFTRAFYKSELFNQDINMWDVSKAASMKSMFSYADGFSQNLNTWNTGRVVDMSNMFENGIQFNQDINSWDTAKVTSLRSMFFYAYYFNQPLSGWETGKTVELSYMFNRAKNFNQDINTWDVSNVEYMTETFSYYIDTADGETQVYFPSFNSQVNSWDTSSLLNSKSMFYNSFAFNQSVSSWDVSRAINIDYMFMKVPTFNDCLTSWALSVQPDVSLTDVFAETACAEQSPIAGTGPWCQSIEDGCPATLDPPGPNSCVNTEFSMIKNEEEKTCAELLNQLLLPPSDVEELQIECNERYESTDPEKDTVLVSEACPTFCNSEDCCPVDEQFQFIKEGALFPKRCGGLLNALLEDKTTEGKNKLIEQCDATLPAVSGGNAVVKDICTGLCRTGCEVVECINKRDDQFLIIPDDENTDNRLGCDEFFKDTSEEEKNTLCETMPTVYNVKKDKILKKKPYLLKKTCRIYCDDRCTKTLALQ